MQTDDSDNLLKVLADPSTWSEGVTFDYESPTRPTEPKVEENTGLPEIVSGNNFPKQYDLVRRTPLVENMTRRGEVTLLSSASKMGKSWWMQNLATCLSEGIPFIGLDTVKSNCLMLDLELSQVDAMDRLWSIALAMGLKHPPKNLHLWSLRKHCYDLGTIIETLHNRLESMPPMDAIFLDPIYMLGQSEDFDENSSSACTMLLTELEKITAKSDAALYVTHHFRKGTMGRESHIDRASGSGVFARFPDCLISLSQHQLAEHAILEMTSRSQKSPKPFVLRMTPPVISVAENADPTCYRKFGQPQPEQEITEEFILELIPLGGSIDKAQWFSDAKYAGATEDEFTFHYNQLRQSGKIKAIQRDGKVTYERNAGL